MSVFRKEDLRTGMRVTRRDGMQFIVLLKCKAEISTENTNDILVSFSRLSTSGFECRNLDNFTDNLCHICSSKYDIIKIETPDTYTSIFINMTEERVGWITVWEREEGPKEEKRETQEATELTLPYKIGSIVYVVASPFVEGLHVSKAKILSYAVESVEKGSEETIVYAKVQLSDGIITKYNIANIFLTPEEAEKFLESIKKKYS